ncbi:MFS transporter [Sphingomonas sp. Y38-1Y]|uniref:MFS transporter n=1 Tax=Sphingomonas sp. Y38-1Y TaxID=3078265 RepID=UPI0028E2C6A2|nr:MFS transporter [Sphingomonas sp. Y38-1Y]
MTGVQAAAPAAPLSDRRRTLAFATVLCAFVLEVADATIVNTALPQIRRGLGAGDIAMQWIAAAYFLGLGSLLLIGGRLGDIFGYRRMFAIGIAAFVAASCLCGLSRNPDELVAARLLQGASGAMMAPQVMAIVQLLYSPLERVARLAWFGVLGGLAAILGPVAGGLLIEADILGLGWRAIFLVNLPLGLMALAAAWRFVPSLKSSAAIRIDIVGALIFMAGFAALLAALIEGPERGWPWPTLAALAGGFALIATGWHHARRREQRIGSAVIATALFGLPTFFWGIVAILAFSAASAGYLLIFAVSLQQGLGLSALDTALAHVPFGLGVMGGISVIGRRWLPVLGRKLLIAGALILAAAGFAVLMRVSAGSATDPLTIALFAVAGLGMGMLAGPLPPVIVADVDRAQAGAASAMLKTAQQIGGAAGVALIGAAYFTAGDGAAARLAGLVPGGAAFVGLLGVAVLAALRLPAVIFAKR